ncbi:hypothetical protein L226DRAFT_454689 [Lentinus tigrinus ALCF2SS1-7]|uniref:uncharacterized protein n=1 Tax=Lentinus tigrinus ALCF2SS1-7 TaxID=1328758 RepID=UPI0011660CC3|nr:hypothetical protein L226DRAFT_454689 [Lentinus tigrinus ALCF2SS1-7]
MQRVDYYQIGGFKAHLRENSSDALADRLLASSRDGGEFVLGMRPNGASNLLLPVRVFQSRRLGRPYQQPWSALDFVSLSPIQFANKRELVAKLKMMESNKKKSDGRPRDRSKANTEYTAGGEGPTEEGSARATFEHQRRVVFYRLCQDTIRCPEDYALNLARWFREVHIVSFAFNLWASDMSSLEERQKNPRVLDLGWTEFDAPTDSEDLRAVSTTHLTLEENRFLVNRGRTRLTLPDISQTMPRASVEKLLQDLFAPERDGERKPPKLLLVYDEEMTRHVLRSFGVDADQLHWVQGIKDLLYCPPAERVHDHAAYGYERDDRRYNAREPRDRSYNSKWPRNRSHSPTRRRPGDEGPRSRSSPPRMVPPSVYLVDVRTMYRNLMRVPTPNDTVPSIAKALNVLDTSMTRGEDDEVIYEAIDPQYWLIGYMWEEMARQESIDEQRVQRQRYLREEPVEVVDETIAAVAVDNGDMDPNDMIQPVAQSTPALRTAAKPVGMYDSEEEDDEW